MSDGTNHPLAQSTRALVVERWEFIENQHAHDVFWAR